MDDAYQHRSVKPGLNILLTQHRLPFTRDWLLPSGRLREWRSAYQRADIIIVTKCPNEISEVERKQFKEEINPLVHQKMYFSKYIYDAPYEIFSDTPAVLEGDMNVIVLCALANADYLVDYVNTKADKVRRLEFADHHFYTNYDMSRLKKIYTDWDVDNKVIVTTEKDATRLALHKEYIAKNNMKILVLPARVEFMGQDTERF